MHCFSSQQDGLTVIGRVANCCLTLSKTTNFRLFQTERFADKNFKFDENDRKLSYWVENTVGKGEIARYEQFLLFPQCFQKACFPGASKGVIVWQWVNPLTHYHTMPHFDALKIYSYGKTL